MLWVGDGEGRGLVLEFGQEENLKYGKEYCVVKAVNGEIREQKQRDEDKNIEKKEEINEQAQCKAVRGTSKETISKEVEMCKLRQLYM